MQNTELAPRYDASLIESKWYAAWEEAGLFQLQEGHSGPNYTITIPPPMPKSPERTPAVPPTSR